MVNVLVVMVVMMLTVMMDVEYTYSDDDLKWSDDGGCGIIGDDCNKDGTDALSCHHCCCSGIDTSGGNDNLRCCDKGGDEGDEAG